MDTLINCLLDFPLREFCRLGSYLDSGVSSKTHSEYFYLLNSPIQGLSIERSGSKIPIGGRGHFSYLNSLTYNLGYVFEVPRSHTIAHSTHILIGSLDQVSIEEIGEISILYIDSHITILQNKCYSSYLIIPATDMNVPQPIY